MSTQALEAKHSRESADDSKDTAEASSAAAAEHAWSSGQAAFDSESLAHRKRGTKRVRESANDAPVSKASAAPGAGRHREMSEVDLEEEVVGAVGMNPWGLNDHEQAALADDLDEEAYFLVRNHILARWRADVTRFLSEEESTSRINPKHKHLVAPAWQYLDREGHINWGVAPAIMSRPGPEHSGSVVIIGAGLAGLAAARQLKNHGYRVVVVEGADRPGGRVYGHRLEGGASGVAAVTDLGGSIITGIDGNPLAVLARQLGIPMHDINTGDVPLYLRDGSQLDQKVDSQVDSVFNKMLDRSAELRDQMTSAAAISLQSALDGLWHRAQLELGLQQPARMQVQQQQGQTGPMLNGAAAAAGSIKVKAEQGTEGVSQPSHHQQQHHGLQQQIEQQQQQQQSGGPPAGLASTFSDDAARNLLMQWHMANIEFANATRLRNLSMKYWDLDDEYEHLGPHVFLPGGNLRLLQALAKDIPIFYKAPARLLQYCSTGVRVHTDAGVFAADAALVTVPLGVLKRPDGLQFQPPLPARKQAAIQRLGFGCLNKLVMLFPHCFWGTKDMFGHVRLEPSQRGLYYLFYAYDGISGGAVLAALVAGDAAVTFESLGQEEAVRDVMQLLRSIFKPQGVEVPEPLEAVVTRWGSDPMSYGSYSSVAVGSAGAADYDAMAKPLGNRVFFAGEATTAKYPATMHGAFATGLREAANIMAALAEQKGETARPKMARGVPEVDDAAAAKGQQLLRLSELLHSVFVTHAGEGVEPDLEFGCIKAVFGPEGSHMEDQALVAINLAGIRSKPKGSASLLYLHLHRSQLELLQELPGDELRLAALVAEMGVKLVGRPLSSSGLQLLEAIAQHRRQLGLFEGQLVGADEPQLEHGDVEKSSEPDGVDASGEEVDDDADEDYVV